MQTSSSDPKEQISSLLHCRPIIINSGDSVQKKEEIKTYFNKTFSLYEKLFEVITNPQAFYLRPEPLRHPLIFYYGHTATFFINKFLIAGLLKQRINPEYESMFAVGVDEMSWDDLLPEHYNWPKLEDLQNYRNRVRDTINRVIEDTPLELPITWDSPFWVIMMGIEHERIHLETSSVIIRRLGINHVKTTDYFVPCPITHHPGYLADHPNIERLPKNILLSVAETTVELSKDGKLYGWDNEYGRFKKHVPSFAASKYLVSNGEYLEFIIDGGYSNETYWTEEGRKWITSTKTQYPLFWVPDPKTPGVFKFRTMTEIREMPWDWPVETNSLEAKAFCNWKAKKTGRKIRLPSEAEYYALRGLIKEDVVDPGFEKKGNISLFHWASSCPIDMFESQGFCDILGNVWQHSETDFNGFQGFKVHKYYDDFSTPTFYGQHSLIKGGSWVSTGNEAMRNSRYAFRRHFFQHAGFRYVEAGDLEEAGLQSFFYQIDEVEAKMLEFNYGEECFGVKNWGKQCAELCRKVFKETGKAVQGRILEVGCNVGRTCFELAKGFEQVVGIDLSARFFHLAVGLQENGALSYMRKEEGEISDYMNIQLEKFDFNQFKDRVSFYQQQDLSNIDILKFHDFDMIFCGNVLENLPNPKDFLGKIHKYLAPKGVLVVASTYDWKSEVTPVGNWLGGFKQDGENKRSYDGLKEVLEEKFEEISQPIEEAFVKRESKYKFQHNIAQFTFWRKK